MDRFNKLKEIILEAGKIVKSGYEQDVDFDKKSATELVTKYDKEVEEFLISKIKPLYSDYEIVGEESFSGKELPSRAIFIDPIDGTTNFVHKIPYLGISIGIWSEVEPQEAIVYNPILNELYSARVGEGAFLNDNKIFVNNESTLQSSVVATGFPYVKHEMGEEYRWVVDSMKRLLPKIRDIRRLGAAAIDLCYLAEGKFSGFYEVNLQPWDVAAGVLILKEAGGKISGIRGIEYSLSNQILVASNSKIHKELLDSLGEFNGE